MAVARATGTTFSSAYVRALETLAASAPAFAGIACAPHGGGAVSGGAVSLRSDTALLCFAHGYRELDAVNSGGGGGGASGAAVSTLAPMCGATVGSFRYGYSRVDPFVVLAALRLPPGGRVEPWCATGEALPRLHAYGELVRANASHFLALASPEAPANRRAALLQRLGAVFPSARIAMGTAMTARARSSAGTLPAHLFSNFSPVGADTTALGFALHLPPPAPGGDAQQQAQRVAAWAATVDRLVAAAYGGVEFEGVQGFACSAELEKRLFLVRNVVVGPTTRPPPPPPTATTATATGPAATAGVTTAASPALPPLPVVPAHRPPTPLGAAAIHALPPSAPHAPSPAPPLRPMPLFLMDSILLPGQRVDVRIFESRYRHMLRRYFEHGELFAVCVPPARIGEYDGEHGGAEDTLQWERAALRAPPPPGGALDGVGTAAVATVLGNDGPTSGVPLATRPASDSSSSSSIEERRVATVVVVRHVHALDTASGRVTVQLEGVRRVRVGSTWVAPATFGLVHGTVSWLDDAAIAHSGPADAAAAGVLPGGGGRASSATRVAGEVAGVLCGTGLGHVRVRQMLAKYCQRREGGGPVLVPTPTGARGDCVPAPTLRPEASPGVGAGHTLASSAAGGGVGSNAGLAAQLASLSPQALSWWLAELLPVPSSVKQLYLETTSTADRLSRQLAFLQSFCNRAMPGGAAREASAGSAGDEEPAAGAPGAGAQLGPGSGATQPAAEAV